ncbi:DUF5655 domain-containing protein [Mucilaginibacter koreensis]
MEPYSEDISEFITGKSPNALTLFDALVMAFETVGNISLHPAKTMIGISNGQKRIAWITQFGKSFLHVVFPFRQPYNNNLCFQKIAQVPGDNHQFNHHFRMLNVEDLNEEILNFMKLAYLITKRK